MGLGWMITPLPGLNGRGAGSLTWGGIFNSYYWIDPAQQVAGVILTSTCRSPIRVRSRFTARSNAPSMMR